jgi:sugar phosphate isomerase/epimerase
MQIKFFCPRWGSEDLDWNSFCKKVKVAGYDGVEAAVPFDATEKEMMLAALQQNKLLFIGQYWQSFENNFEAHKKSYINHLQHLGSVSPIKIDAQTGKDYFTFTQNKELFEIATEFTNATNIPVAHETHRNKALFAAHITKDFLQQLPHIKITADFSHWCNVAESYLEDQEEALEIAIAHAIHIHARVGHTQSAQVPDPRLPEWQEALLCHIDWWKKIMMAHEKSGKAFLTITSEFGPAPYMPLDIVSKKPIANQWDINVWMMQYLKNELL